MQLGYQLEDGGLLDALLHFRYISMLIFTKVLALLKTFAASGLGVFPAGKLIEKDLKETYGTELLGDCDDIYEYFYAIRSEKKIQNPLVQAIIKR